MVPFSVLWCGFAIVWTWLAFHQAESRWFALVGLLFVAVGLYMVFGRFIAKKRRKLKTVYGLTDTRAIVLVGERDVSDVRMKDVPVQINRSRDGRHVRVIFGQGGVQTMYLNTGMEFFTPGQAATVAFFYVPDPDALLRELDRVR